MKMTTYLDHHFVGYKDIDRCYTLDQGAWQPNHPMSTARYLAAASQTGAGWMVSGGKDGTDTELSSTEILTADGWVTGPTLPEPRHGHCQTSMKDKTFVAGNARLQSENLINLGYTYRWLV